MRILPTFAPPKNALQREVPHHPVKPSLTPTITPLGDTVTFSSQKTFTPITFAGSDDFQIGHANEAMDEVGTTWIHYAALADDLDVAKVLVKQPHVNYEQLNSKGLTPLTVCAATGHHQIAKLYRAHGAKLQVIYSKDAHGNIDESKPFIHPSDLARKHSKSPATIHFFEQEEKAELTKILRRK